MVEDLPDKIRTYRMARLLIGSDNPTELVPMEEVERRYIHHVLTAVGGNKILAARVLGFAGYNGFCGSCSTPFIEPEASKFSSQLSA